jgi:SOS-response transcriptional repressor LexA
MEPEYREGDLIIVNPQLEPRAGDDIVAHHDGDVTFKRLKKTGGTVLLSPLNTNYADIIITGKDLKNYRVVGVVEGFMRKRNRR